MFLRFVTFTSWNYYVLKLLRLETITFSDATLKVPKREIFVTELFTRSDPIWIGDMRTEPIKPFV
jgi:hypothetical protein